MIIVGMALLGFGGANCQMAAFALPELLPNKWRHIGVVIAGKLHALRFRNNRLTIPKMLAYSLPLLLDQSQDGTP